MSRSRIRAGGAPRPALAFALAAVALVLVVLVALVGTPGAGAAPSRVRLGRAPGLPRRAQVLGAVPAAVPVHVTIGLAGADPAGLRRMAAAISDPTSPRFRDYLTVSQFARRFGAPASQVAAVRGALRAEGLTVGQPTANRLTIPASGSAGGVQRAFGTTLERVRLASGRVAFANRTAPAVPAAIAGEVTTVAGLDDLHLPRPAGRAARPPARAAGQAARPLPRPAGRAARPRARAAGRAARPRARAAGSGPQPCSAVTGITQRTRSYAANTIAAAYGLASLYRAGDSGSGQTIALYELQTLDPADVAVFQHCYGTHTQVSYDDIDHPPAGGDDAEAALDIDQLIGLAPGARVIVYQAPPTGAANIDILSTIMSQDRAATISTSWGACEPYLSDGQLRMENELFDEAAVQGQSVIAASGDSGSADCVGSDGDAGLAVDDPASQPMVTGVGGTTLYSPAAGGQAVAWAPGLPLAEGVWNQGTAKGAPLATGGGVSSLWSMPRYQSSAPVRLGVVSPLARPACGAARCREVPDVSANANPATGYVVYIDGGWAVYGGTSAAAPLWAAMTALTNALPACRGLSIGFQNPSLYTLAGRGGPAFRDITGGDPTSGLAGNDALGVNGGLYPVASGYDLATGLGAPDAAALAPGLCGLRAPVYAVALANPGTRTAYYRSAFRLATRATDSGHARLRYSASGLPRGLRINARTGVISGRPIRLGSSLVTVRATDDVANRSSSRFRLRVITPLPRFTAVRLAGVARGRPELAFTVARGRYAPPLRSITVRLAPGLSFGRGGGIAVFAGRRPVGFTPVLRGGALVIAFRTVQSSVGVTIGPPTIQASGKLAAQARQGRAGPLALSLDATDQHRRTSRFRVAIRVRG
ncbi:MAG: S8/S53 family peptidase [Solirubrobacterales bacterium]|nr:S8/S53 family peptidase [Solirubrobacterales bacterium]